MGLIPLVIGILLFISGFLMTSSVDGVLQQNIQYLTFVCASLFISSSFLCFSIQVYMPQKVTEVLQDMTAKIDSITVLLKNEKIQSDSPSSKNDKQTIAEERKREIKTYEDLIADPRIKEESDMLLKMYGENTQRQFLEKKMKEAGISISS